MPALLKNKSLLFILLLLLTASLSIESADFHLLLVGDFERDDQSRKEFTHKDLAAIRKEAYTIAEALSLPVTETTLQGSLNAQQVLDLVEELEIQPDDLVVFYFSGHGFSLFSQVDDPWPDLLFSGDDQAFALSTLIELFERKNAQFTFIFADCCNNLMPDALLSQPLLKPKTRRRIVDQIEAENYKKLFLDTQGIVVLCAAKKKQLAHARASGSLCTHSFLEALHEKVLDFNYIDWQDLLDTTVHKVGVAANTVKKIQEPIFFIQE